MDLDFYKNNNINVDLAIEAHDIVRGELGTEIPGAVVDRHKFPNAAVTTVKVVEERAAQMMGKPVGTYITIEAPAIRDNNRIAQKKVAEILAQHCHRCSACLITPIYSSSVWVIGKPRLIPWGPR